MLYSLNIVKYFQKKKLRGTRCPSKRTPSDDRLMIDYFLIIFLGLYGALFIRNLS